ncbi:hypothetical protein V5N11_018927 [Cardamine amara subsp. amara]|uniref:HpcH/HpaI aldolase/citrate lyase domain-containing protein n=1 Tax=Cardamine amara subsp. amara TaxID=228776 RepID=A0ABD1BZB9_CARAN
MLSQLFRRFPCTSMLQNLNRTSMLHRAQQSPTNSIPSIAFFSSQRSLKSRLREGENLYGLFLLSFSPEIVAFAGYDFIVIDLEHGAGGIREALNCIRAVEAAGSSTVLRIPDNCQAWTKKALDLGPDGIMFPMIETGKAASDAVSHTAGIDLRESEVVLTQL